jgi:hypothetical protein
MDATSPPEWVRKCDWRLEPFDADKISRALFAATESLGRPDAFLARELADGVVHFLADEAAGATPTTQQIAELVAKVVRELGQPALAAAFTEHGLQRRREPRPPRPHRWMRWLPRASATTRCERCSPATSPRSTGTA